MRVKIFRSNATVTLPDPGWFFGDHIFLLGRFKGKLSKRYVSHFARWNQGILLSTLPRRKKTPRIMMLLFSTLKVIVTIRRKKPARSHDRITCNTTQSRHFWNWVFYWSTERNHRILFRFLLRPRIRKHLSANTAVGSETPFPTTVCMYPKPYKSWDFNYPNLNWLQSPEFWTTSNPPMSTPWQPLTEDTHTEAGQILSGGKFRFVMGIWPGRRLIFFGKPLRSCTFTQKTQQKNQLVSLQK